MRPDTALAQRAGSPATASSALASLQSLPSKPHSSHFSVVTLSILPATAREGDDLREQSGSLGPSLDIFSQGGNAPGIHSNLLGELSQHSTHVPNTRQAGIAFAHHMGDHAASVLSVTVSRISVPSASATSHNRARLADAYSVVS